MRPPGERPGALPRQRLVDRLFVAAKTKRLTLVVAPVGFGKSTLLAAVHRRFEQHGLPCLWLNARDAAHDSLRLDSVLRDRLVDQLKIPASFSEDFISYLRRIQPLKIVIIVDDWNIIDCDKNNDYVDRLLSEADLSACVVIGAERFPNFLYENFMLEEDYEYFGPKDLAFSLEEIRTLLAGGGHPRRSGALDALIANTEGWPAGLQLLRLALNQIGDAGVEKLQFTGERPDVVDYFTKKLFRGLPLERRMFLCNIAILDQFCLDLIIHVTKDPGYVADFIDVTHNKTFVTEVRDGSSSYRFHRLFRDFLRVRRSIESVLPEKVILLRACEWHEARGELHLAIPYALRAREASRAKHMLQNYVACLRVPDGNISMFSEWVNDLLHMGEALTPQLDLWYRWSLTYCGRWERAIQLQPPSSAEQSRLIDCLNSALSDDQIALTAALERPNTSDTDAFSDAQLRALSSLANLARGNLTSAARDAARAKMSIDQTGSAFGRTLVLKMTAWITLLHGHAEEAMKTISEADELATNFVGDASSSVRCAKMMKAIVHYHRGEDYEARAEFHLAQRAVSSHDAPYVAVWADAVARALCINDSVAPQATRPRSPAIALTAEAFRVEAAMRAEPDGVRLCSLFDTFDSKIKAAVDENPSILRHSWTLRDHLLSMRCRVLLGAGDYDQALRILNKGITECQRHGRGLIGQQLALLKVGVLLRQGKRTESLRLLIQTADLAVRDHLFRFFKDEATLIGSLFSSLLSAGERAPLGNDHAEWRRFADFLRGTSNDILTVVSIKEECNSQIRLSARERELLQFIDIGLTNQEISARLGITVQTVKWHLHNLFSKLGVKNRSSAAHIARDMRAN